MMAINIQLINDFNQSVDDSPIEEQNVWMDDVIPTIRKMIDLRKVDELLLVGPAKFTDRIKDRIENNFPNLKVILGDNDD